MNEVLRNLRMLISTMREVKNAVGLNIITCRCDGGVFVTSSTFNEMLEKHPEMKEYVTIRPLGGNYPNDYYKEICTSDLRLYCLVTFDPETGEEVKW